MDEFLSKLNLEFPNYKSAIKSSSLTFKMLSLIISTVFNRILRKFTGGSAGKNVLLIPLQATRT